MHVAPFGCMLNNACCGWPSRCVLPATRCSKREIGGQQRPAAAPQRPVKVRAPLPAAARLLPPPSSLVAAVLGSLAQPFLSYYLALGACLQAAVVGGAGKKQAKGFTDHNAKWLKPKARQEEPSSEEEEAGLGSEDEEAEQSLSGEEFSSDGIEGSDGASCIHRPTLHLPSSSCCLAGTLLASLRVDRRTNSWLIMRGHGAERQLRACTAERQANGSMPAAPLPQAWMTWTRMT